ncbi:hypothetical protein L9F63_001756, partial [Diploptera punctata]
SFERNTVLNLYKVERARLSECYFAGKGAALVLPPNERLRPLANNSNNINNSNGSSGSNCSRRVSASGSDIQQHLQSMFYLLRPEETLKMPLSSEAIRSLKIKKIVINTKKSFGLDSNGKKRIKLLRKNNSLLGNLKSLTSDSNEPNVLRGSFMKYNSLSSEMKADAMNFKNIVNKTYELIINHLQGNRPIA